MTIILEPYQFDIIFAFLVFIIIYLITTWRAIKGMRKVIDQLERNSFETLWEIKNYRAYSTRDIPQLEEIVKRKRGRPPKEKTPQS